MKPETTPKFTYRKPPNNSSVRGIDLNIDLNTQKICETYNQSSGATRSVLYLLLIVSVISLIAVFNNNWKYNWTRERIAANRARLDTQNVFLDSLSKNKSKTSILDSLNIVTRKEYLKKRIDGYVQSDIENNNTIKISFLGISIDINDLASISGIAFILLYFVLRVTLTREKHNLKIAINSITERYTNDSDFELFKEIIQKKNKRLGSKIEERWDELVSDINFVRRRYHYNFLSMNEIFNLPFLDTSDNVFQEKPLGRFINKYLFLFFIIAYTIVLFNDYCSMVFRYNTLHIYIIIVISSICFIIIFNLCFKCVEQKKVIYNLFRNFWLKDYTYDFEDNSIYDLPLWAAIIYPLLILCGLFVLARLFILIPGFKNK